MTILLSSRPIALKTQAQFSIEFMLVVIATMLITGRLFESNLTLVLPAYFFAAEKMHWERGTTWKQYALPILSVMLIDLHRLIWTVANPDKQALPWFLLIFPFLGVILMWTVLAEMRLREIKTVEVGMLREPS
jgi:hypothetical protein